MNSHQNLSLLESLPQDLLGEILSRVGSASVQAIAPCLTVSKTISSAVEDQRVFKELNIRHQAINPMVTFYRWEHRMAKCLSYNHPVAHYVEGIKQFFVYDNRTDGLFHLRKSAEGLYDNGTYLYSMVLLCTGNIAEGKTVLRSLGWEASRQRANRAWRAVRMSMRFVFAVVKDEYTENLNSNRPPNSCHRNDMRTRCPRCFEYKQMRRFIVFLEN